MCESEKDKPPPVESFTPEQPTDPPCGDTPIGFWDLTEDITTGFENTSKQSIPLKCRIGFHAWDKWGDALDTVDWSHEQFRKCLRCNQSQRRKVR